jgi:general secretion pathway protein M
MMPLPTGRRGQMLALGITVVLIVVAWIGVVGPAVGWYQDRAETLAQRRVLAGHMAAVAATAPALQAELQAAVANGPPARAVLEGATDAIAGAALQQQVQDMTSQVGATLTSAESLPAEQAGVYRRIGLHVSVTAPWTVMVALFAAIQNATPRMLVDDIQLQSGMLLTASNATHPLEASFTVLAFHTGTAAPP